MTNPSGKRTPLYPIYEKYGARKIDFGGWEMPVQFEGILQEHDAVRNRAGLFDVSHMGEIVVTGEDAEAFLQRMMTNHIAKLQAGQIQYTAMCYPDGGTVDDLLVYKKQEGHYLLVVNASNLEKDWEWLKKHQEGKVKVEDVSEQTALLAIQGPKAEQILQSLTDEQLADIRPFTFRSDVQIGDIKLLLSRTGYTGEDGFEMYVPAEDAIRLWELLMDSGKEEGLVPVGLGARDTLRFEAKLPLYGQELSADITPLEAGLGFAVKLDQGDFIGRTALLEQKQQGIPRKIVGIEMVDRGIPRSGYPVYVQTMADQFVETGQVTTGTQSPTLKKNVGLVLISSDFAQVDQELFVEIRGKKLRAKVVPTPFYKSRRGNE